jgi:hypothetical protein
MIHLATQTDSGAPAWRAPALAPRADSVLPRRRRGGRAWPFRVAVRGDGPLTAARPPGSARPEGLRAQGVRPDDDLPDGGS